MEEIFKSIVRFYVAWILAAFNILLEAETFPAFASEFMKECLVVSFCEGERKLVHEHEIKSYARCPDVHFIAVSVFAEKLGGEEILGSHRLEHPFFSLDKLAHREIVEIDVVISNLDCLRSQIAVDQLRVMQFLQAIDHLGKEIQCHWEWADAAGLACLQLQNIRLSIIRNNILGGVLLELLDHREDMGGKYLAENLEVIFVGVPKLLELVHVVLFVVLDGLVDEAVVPEGVDHLLLFIPPDHRKRIKYYPNDGDKSQRYTYDWVPGGF